MSLSVAGVKAFEMFARSGVETAAKLVPLGDEALPFVTESLGSASRSLAKLASHDAQVRIGPAVNFAQQTLKPLQGLADAAAAGHMPSPDALDHIRTGLGVLSRAIAGRG